MFAFLFYLSSILFGMSIAQSVVEEKQNRIVEILASAIPVRQLLIGKVAGNTVLAFAQLTLFVVAGLIGLAATGRAGQVGQIAGAHAAGSSSSSSSDSSRLPGCGRSPDRWPPVAKISSPRPPR